MKREARKCTLASTGRQYCISKDMEQSCYLRGRMGLVNYSLPVQPFRLSNPLCHLTQCQFLMSGVAQPTSLCSLWKQLPCLWRLRDGEKLPLGLNSISYGLPYLGEWVTLLALAGVLRSKSTHAFVNKFNFFFPFYSCTCGI